MRNKIAFTAAAILMVTVLSGCASSSLREGRKQLNLANYNVEPRSETSTVSSQLDAAEKHFRDAIEDDPDNSNAWFYLGLTLSKQGRLDEAIDAYTESIDLDDDDEHTWNNRGAVYMKQENAEMAERDFRKAIQIDDDYATPQYNLARIEYYFRDNPQSALGYANKAIELNDDNPWHFYLRGKIRQDLGNTEGAQEDFARALTIDPAFEPLTGMGSMT